METNYTIKDLQNPSTLQLVTKVMGCVESRLDSKLLVEEVGWGLIQHGWSDENWNYAVVRGTPIWVSGRPERKTALIDGFVTSLRAAFNITGAVEVESMGPDPEDRVVVRWGRSRHSIGD